jgi:hypothetical protein
MDLGPQTDKTKIHRILEDTKDTAGLTEEYRLDSCGIKPEVKMYVVIYD